MAIGKNNNGGANGKELSLDNKMGRPHSINREQAEYYFGFTVRQLRAWAAEKKGPQYHKIKGKIIYKWKVMEEFTDQNPVLTTGKP